METSEEVEGEKTFCLKPSRAPPWDNPQVSDSKRLRQNAKKWPMPARLLHGFSTEDMVVLLQTRLPCPECQPASATTQQQAFLSDGSGQCSLCWSMATNQVTLSFNSPYKRANFRDDFLVYDQTTGKTPVLVRLPK